MVARSKVDFILAVPTASWSADSNTLCLVRADGSRFEKVDQMLLNTQWFKWAPANNILAYIEGSGRVALENKHLKVKIASTSAEHIYTERICRLGFYMEE